MPLIDKHPEAARPRVWWSNLSAWGGLLAVCGGLFHTVVAALTRYEVWAQIVDEGFFNTVTLEPSADRLAVAEAFWFSPGSFGVPLLLLGALVTWLTRRGERVPGWLGCGVAAWAVLIGLLGGFDTGTIILLSIGVLLAVGAWNARRAPDRGTRPA
jgi:Na+(H+)/acetate symporter ActP